MTRARMWFLVGLVLTAVLLLLCAGTLFAAAVWLFSPAASPASVLPSVTAPVPEPTATLGADDAAQLPESPTPAPTALAPQSTSGTPPEATPTATIPPEILQLLHRLEQETQALRELKAKHPVSYEFVSREEMKARMREDFEEEYSEEDVIKDAVEFWVLGLMPRDTDLRELFASMYGEAVAGYYDDETKHMVIVSEATLPAHARQTYVHEFVHALQDQYWDLGTFLSDELCEQDTEACAARQALVEGDAQTVDTLWYYLKATARERAAIQEHYRSLDMPAWDAAPEFLKEDILFPYVQGANFVQYFLAQGGWARVNQLFDDPPVSTEQILHPERYPTDKPLNVPLPDLPALLGEDWEAAVETNALGEWSLYLTLAFGMDNGRIPEDEAKRAAEGWGGDRYAVYYRPDDPDAVVFYQDLRWDTRQDGLEFRMAFLHYAENRFGPAEHPEKGLWVWPSTRWGTVYFRAVDDQRYLWIIAPDAALAERLMQAGLALDEAATSPDSAP